MDMDAPGLNGGKEEAVGKQEVDIVKAIPGSDVISTVEKEDKEKSCQTGHVIADVATTEQNKTEVATTKVNNTGVATSKTNQTELAISEVNKTEVATSEVNKTEVVATEKTRADVAKQEVSQTEVVKIKMDETEVGKAELVKTKVVKAEAVKTEIAKAKVNETAVEKDQPRVAETEPGAVTTQPESVKPETELIRTEPDDANAELVVARNGPEVANINPEVNKATPAEPGPDTKRTGEIIVRQEAKVSVIETSVKEPPRSAGSSAGSSLGSTQRSAMTRTRYSIESDSEISEILRDAPPPTPWEEEDDGAPLETGDRGTGGGGTGDGEATGDMETIVIMKKTFTESVMPDQEFIPISDDSDSSASVRNSLPTLRTLVVPTVTSAQEVANDLEKEVGRVVENGAGEANKADRTNDDQSILSKAQMEAQDLTSEFRRLQYLLENLTALGDLELTPAAQEPVEQNLNPVSSQLSLKTEPQVERF